MFGILILIWGPTTVQYYGRWVCIIILFIPFMYWYWFESSICIIFFMAYSLVIILLNTRSYYNSQYCHLLTQPMDQAYYIPYYYLVRRTRSLTPGVAGNHSVRELGQPLVEDSGCKSVYQQPSWTVYIYVYMYSDLRNGLITSSYKQLLLVLRAALAVLCCSIVVCIIVAKALRPFMHLFAHVYIPCNPQGGLSLLLLLVFLY